MYDYLFDTTSRMEECEEGTRDFLAKPVTESENRGAGAGSFCDTRLKILLHDILASLRP